MPPQQDLEASWIVYSGAVESRTPAVLLIKDRGRNDVAEFELAEPGGEEAFADHFDVRFFEGPVGVEAAKLGPRFGFLGWGVGIWGWDWEVLHFVALSGGEHLREYVDPFREGSGRGDLLWAAVGLGRAGDVDSQPRAAYDIGLGRPCITMQDVEMEVRPRTGISFRRFASNEGGETGLVAYVEFKTECAGPRWGW